MKTALNILYVQSQGSYLHLEGDTIKIEVERETKARIPLHHLEGITVFGNVLLSPFLIQRCGDDGRAVTWLTQYGRFKAQLRGKTTGNVLLRRAQHKTADDTHASLSITQRILAGKLQNARNTLMRAARETTDSTDKNALQEAALEQAYAIRQLRAFDTLEALRGVEGTAARVYFGAFTHMIRANREHFAMDERNKRPPRDPINALLSFTYSLLTSECVAACEHVGLDPQIGFLHVMRPGRPSLALDVMEEYRSCFADRLVLTLINRQQIQPKHFITREGGAVHLDDDGRKILLVAYQERKKDEITHPFTGTTIPFGLVPHLQARLLARHLRGDIEHYPPFILK